jgi:hypothetical protein
MENKIIFALFILFPLVFCFLSGCATTPGTLEISSSPPDAQVFLDNQYKGMTPLTIPEVPPGNHSLELRLKGYEPWSISGTVEDGGDVRVQATLVPVTLPGPVTTDSQGIPVPAAGEPIQTGSLIVGSKPGYADVYINSVYRGKSPLALKNIPVGTYTIQVSMAGYGNWSGEATVSSLETTLVSATLTPVP